MVEIKTYVEIPKVPKTVQALVIPDFRSNTELENETENTLKEFLGPDYYVGTMFLFGAKGPVNHVTSKHKNDWQEQYIPLGDYLIKFDNGRVGHLNKEDFERTYKKKEKKGEVSW